MKGMRSNLLSRSLNPQKLLLQGYCLLCLASITLPALAQPSGTRLEYKGLFPRYISGLAPETIWLFSWISFVCFVTGIQMLTFKYLYFRGKASAAKADRISLVVMLSFMVPAFIFMSKIMTFLYSAGATIYFLLAVGFFVLFTAIAYNDRTWAIATEKYNQGDYPAAIELFEQAISRRPECHEFYLWCAYSYSNLEKLDEALLVCDRALTAIPNQLDIRALRASILVDLFRVEEASIELNQLIEQHPEYERLFETRANLFLQQYKYDEALKDLKAIHFPTIWAKLKRCVALVGLNRYEEASDEFHAFMRNMKEQLPRKHMSILMLYSGWIRIMERKFDTAIQEYTTALELDQQSIGACLNRAYCYLVQEKYELAHNDISIVQAKTLEASKKQYCQYVYSIYLWRTGDLPGALKIMQETINAPSERTIYLSYLGQLTLIDGRLEDAKAFLDEAISLDPNSAEAHYVRSRLFDKTGQTELAAADRAKVEAWKYRPCFEW